MDFSQCKNVLIIRPDNMGDLLMSSPAIRAIKQSFNCKITVLCSSKAVEMAKMIAEIDECIAFDLPWLKFDSPEENLKDLTELLKQKSFDGCVLFNVYSQNPAPCLMLAYLAGIKFRAAYSRENLYGLLTHWLPDDEPFSVIRHQVERDLNLARFLGANCTDDRMQITMPAVKAQLNHLEQVNLLNAGYFVLHCGVSEKKRRYPKENWIALSKLLIAEYSLQLVFTGIAAESDFVDQLVNEVGEKAVNLAGKLNLEGLATVINHAYGIISVNTGPMHLAVALNTPLVALYAQTNPQHTPFKSPHRILEYSVPDDLKSSNQIIRMVNATHYAQYISYPSALQVIKQLKDLLAESNVPVLPHEQGFHRVALSNL